MENIKVKVVNPVDKKRIEKIIKDYK